MTIKPEKTDILASLSEPDRKFFLSELARHTAEAGQDKNTNPLIELREQLRLGNITEAVYQEQFLEICNQINPVTAVDRTPKLRGYEPWDSWEHKERELALAHELGIRFATGADMQERFDFLTPHREALATAEALGAAGIGITPTDEDENTLADLIAPYGHLTDIAADLCLMESIGLPIRNPALSLADLHRTVTPFREAHHSQTWPPEDKNHVESQLP